MCHKSGNGCEAVPRAGAPRHAKVVRPWRRAWCAEQLTPRWRRPLILCWLRRCFPLVHSGHGRQLVIDSRPGPRLPTTWNQPSAGGKVFPSVPWAEPVALHVLRGRRRDARAGRSQGPTMPRLVRCSDPVHPSDPNEPLLKCWSRTASLPPELETVGTSTAMVDATPLKIRRAFAARCQSWGFPPASGS